MRPAFLIAVLLALVLPGARGQGEPPERKPTLLVPVYFYQGHSVGKESRSTGLQASRDHGRSFECLTWPELITNSVAVDESGRHIYLACGNGVMISGDAGRTWRLTGGWEMAEVQRVTIDRRDPGRAWAATAYGLFRKEPGSDDWFRSPSDGQFRYCSDVLQDAEDPNRLLVATFRGLFESLDGGHTFWASPVAGMPVRRVVQAYSDPKRLFLATDGKGLLESDDGGGAFRRMEGPPETVFCVVQHPHEPRMLLCGTTEGLFTTHDGGETWTAGREGLPEEYFIYGIVAEPTQEGRIVVCGNDGLFWSVDGGRSFRRLGFENALVQDVVRADLAVVPEDGPADEPGELELGEPYDLEDCRPEEDPAFDARKEGLLEHYRTLPVPPKGMWMRGALHVADGKAGEAFWELVRKELEAPPHSMFFSMPLMGFYLHARDEMPEDVADRIREVMTTNPVYRGDTENHWVMHYAAALLAAQTWPGTSAAEWYTGRTSRDIYDEAKGWFLHWVRLTASRGQGEFDSPNYFFMYVTPMLLLYDFAEEPRVRMAAGMILDLLLADYFVESLAGAWCGGHSRIIGKEVELTTGNRVSVLHHLYAGGIERPAKPHPWMIFAALSGYRPPDILAAIANREGSYEHFERKRVRNVIRFGEELNPAVLKRTLMTPRYGMGSLQGGILQPIQQHTWDVTWLGSAENSTLFTVHPSVSARELAMFFPEDVRDITRTITNQKGVYSSPDKLVSASPWERVRQRRNELLAYYRVPEGERFPHVDLYWPDHLTLTEEGGWLFGRDGEFWLGVRPTRKGSWLDADGFRRYRCPADRTGFAVVTRPYEPERQAQTFEEFRKELLARPAPVIEEEGRVFRLGELRLDWDEWGRADQYELFGEVYISGAVGYRVIHLTDGEYRSRTLDFNQLSIRESR